MSPATWKRVSFGTFGDDYVVGAWSRGGIQTPGYARSRSFFWRTGLESGSSSAGTVYDYR
ncbi:MAG: hypothetical protein ACRC35_03110, partial [Angustibacter sp.]